jgi:hypothetical protein
LTAATATPGALRPPDPSSRARHAGSARLSAGRAAAGSRPAARAPCPRAARSARPGCRSATRPARRERLETAWPARAGAAGAPARRGRHWSRSGRATCGPTAPFEAIDLAPGAQERLLDHVLGVLRRAEHPVAMDLERRAIGLDQAAERALVPGVGGSDQKALLCGLSDGGVHSSPHPARRSAARNLIDEVARSRSSNRACNGIVPQTLGRVRRS